MGKLKHGHADGGLTPTYQSWRGMHARCRQETHKQWSDYGGRGIRVCARWSKFENFLADMGERPAGMSIDRINSDGNYSKANCRWATMPTQQRNRRSTVWIEIDGRRMCASDWAREKGVPLKTLLRRFRNGVPAGELFAPAFAPRRIFRHSKFKRHATAPE